MRYSNSIGSIPIILIAAAILSYGLMGGIRYVAGNLYHDEIAYPLSLMQPTKVLSTAPVNVEEEAAYSFWLKVPDRQIENKDLQFVARLVDDQGQVVTEFSENFQRGYLRNSSGTGQYYSVGKYEFSARFKGSFQYETSGAWQPPYNAVLVLRRRGKNIIPYKHAFVMAVGIMVLFIGIRQRPHKS